MNVILPHTDYYRHANLYNKLDALIEYGCLQACQRTSTM